MTLPITLATTRKRPTRSHSAEGWPMEATVSEVHGIDSHLYKVVIRVEHQSGDVRCEHHRFDRECDARAFARREMR